MKSILIQYIEMKKYFKEASYRLTTLLISISLGCSLFISCVDENPYANNEPTWLGASIYSYLQSDGNFKTYVKLIDELGYTETLNKTGSKTLFVANDSAFEKFFQQNAWGVTRYEELSLAQKKLILNYGMINNAYTSDNLPNFNNGTSLILGAAMRRATAISVYDSIPHDYPADIPAGTYWDKFRTGSHATNGVYILKDNTSWPLVQFTQKELDQDQITDDDFYFLTGTTRVKNDIHILDKKIIKRDITCKNGYINVLQSVLIPPVNMAQYLKNNSNPNIPETKRTAIFSKLLDRFSAPYFNAGNTLAYKQLQLQHPELPSIDSIFVKGYFSEYVNGNGYPNYPGVNGQSSGSAINTDLLLPFNPGWNSYIRNANNSYLQSDMAAIFAPSDAAMTSYLRSGGILSKYNSWDDIPDNIVMAFLKKLMRSSLIASLPSRFNNMVDEQNYPLPVQRNDIDLGNVYLGVNGAVFITNKVYIPEVYASVYAPVLFSDTTKVFDWFIKNYGGDVPLYYHYLNSLVNNYSFFVPSDVSFGKFYIDPVAYAKTYPAAIKFWYNQTVSPATVYATMYKYDPTTGSVYGDSILIKDADFIMNRLLDIMETHIVVNGVESGENFYLAKGNNVIHIKSGSGNSLIVQGGGDMAMGTEVKTTKSFVQSNGYVYITDKLIQSPLTSVYKVLSETDAFKEFFNLMNNFPSGRELFTPLTTKSTLEGMDYNVKFFNTFNYTVYVPTNDAILQAYKDTVIMSWDAINSLPTSKAAYKAYEINKLERFIRYHFQDNSVFVGGKTLNGEYYQTATIKTDDGTTLFGTSKNKYYKIKVTSSGNDMSLETENGGTATVINTIDVTSNKYLYNIMTRDYVFNYNPTYFKEIDGSGGKTSLFTTSRIETSSTAVIHQINKVLSFQ
jgi:uncharacterized surface protein with fasciclin (FAS1) repeats